METTLIEVLPVLIKEFRIPEGMLRICY